MVDSPNSERQKKPDPRTQAEDALASGDLELAIALAEKLSQRKAVGPWDKVVLGRIALADNNATQAVNWFKQAREELPNEGSILVDLASSLAAKKKWSEAAKTLAEAIEQRPTIADLHERHAIYLANAGRQNEADDALERVLALNGTHPGAWAFTGERQMASGDLNAAKLSFGRAIESDPSHRSALSNLALLHEREGDLDAALRILEHLCTAYESDASFQHRRGQILLSMGRLADGWRDYARRLKSKAYKSWQYALQVPYWAGEDITGKHLVVWMDQGLGEQILTASLIPEMLKKTGAVTLACDPRLCPLFERSFPDVRVVSLEATRNKGEGLGQIDVQASISELGAYLRPELTSFPNPAPFLKPDMERVASFRKKLQDDESKPLVGLSWRSSNPLAGQEKSTDLIKQWSPILSCQGVRFVSLQYGETSQELYAALKETGAHIIKPELQSTVDVDGFAAFTAAMDLVISISNTSVHVAGALGVPTWALLPHAYGRPWYWFAEGETSPWYDSVKLYRSGGDWSPIFERVAKHLEQWISP